MQIYKNFPAWRAPSTTITAFPKNPMNDWLVAEHQKRFNAPPDFFTAGGFAAASAAVAALEKAGGTDTEKLIAAMEGMTFDTPKGQMTFRKEDHQALQVMYHFKVKVSDARMPNDLARRCVEHHSGREDADPGAQQALIRDRDMRYRRARVARAGNARAHHPLRRPCRRQ